MNSELLRDQRDHVAYLTLNRPERRNAIGRNLRELLISTLTELGEDPDVRAIVITGTGDLAFSAGADLKELNETAQAKTRFPTPMTGLQRNHCEVILETYKPTIAVLNGPALAGGCEIALACDIRIAAEHASLGLPEAKVGMGANFGSVLLPRLVPRAIALEMLYTGLPISAQEALKWGLVNRVAPKERLMEVAEDFVRSIVVNAPLTVQRYKHMAIKAWELPIHSALRLNAGPDPYNSADREEGVRARLERRPPVWKGA